MLDLLISGAAAAQAVVERTPFSYGWLTYVWVVMWAALGGVVSFHRKVKAGTTRWCNIAELIGELATSAFVGVMTFWLCEWGNIPPLLSAVFIAISGHMGSRAIFWGERVITRWIENRSGVGPINGNGPPGGAP